MKTSMPKIIRKTELPTLEFCDVDLSKEIKEVAEAKEIPFDKVVKKINELSNEEKTLVDEQLKLLSEIIGKGRVWRYTTAHLIMRCIEENIPLIDIGQIMLNAPVVGDAYGARFHFIITKKDWNKIKIWREKMGLEERAFLSLVCKKTGLRMAQLSRYVDDFMDWLKKEVVEKNFTNQMQYLVVSTNPRSYNYYLAAYFLEYLKTKGVLKS